MLRIKVLRRSRVNISREAPRLGGFLFFEQSPSPVGALEGSQSILQIFVVAQRRFKITPSFQFYNSTLQGLVLIRMVVKWLSENF